MMRHSEFMVQPGMILEIAIIMQQETAHQIERCPRCDHLSLNATVHYGWIDWQACTYKLWLNLSCSIGCPAQFQVAIVDTTNDEGGPVSKENTKQNNRDQN